MCTRNLGLDEQLDVVLIGLGVVLIEESLKMLALEVLTVFEAELAEEGNRDFGGFNFAFEFCFKVGELGGIVEMALSELDMGFFLPSSRLRLEELVAFFLVVLEHLPGGVDFFVDEGAEALVLEGLGDIVLEFVLPYLGRYDIGRIYHMGESSDIEFLDEVDADILNEVADILD